jgi:hypothetical protein
VADALNAMDETGLTPRQLVEQRAELLEAVRAFIEWDDRENDHAVDFGARMDLYACAISKARAAIAKCEAQVYGDAQVYGAGLICWFSCVGNKNGTLTVYNARDSALLVTRGRFIGTPGEFIAASATKHNARIQHEYKLLIEVARSRIEAARAALPPPAEPEAETA